MIDLKKILEKHPEAAGNSRMMLGLLQDHYPDYERKYEIRILITFIESGFTDDLISRKKDDQTITVQEQTKLIKKLENEYGYQIDRIESIFRLWADALGLKVEGDAGIVSNNEANRGEKASASRKNDVSSPQQIRLSDSDPEKTYKLGMDLYNSGKYEAALPYIRSAAEQGFAAAQNSLGDMYYEGEGVPESDKEAVKYYRLAADQGYAAAQNNLGLMYDNGQGVPQSDKEALKYYRLAADQGYAAAQINLGYMYQYGQGVPQSDKTAVKYFRLAADQGNAVAQYNLGLMYQEGLGVPQSDKAALKYYRLAADQGDAAAQYKLGEKYEYGDGVEQSDEEALKYYRLAAAQGDEDAIVKLDILE